MFFVCICSIRATRRRRKAQLTWRHARMLNDRLHTVSGKTRRVLRIRERKQRFASKRTLSSMQMQRVLLALCLGAAAAFAPPADKPAAQRWVSTPLTFTPPRRTVCRRNAASTRSRCSSASSSGASRSSRRAHRRRSVSRSDFYASCTPIAAASSLRRRQREMAMDRYPRRLTTKEAALRRRTMIQTSGPGGPEPRVLAVKAARLEQGERRVARGRRRPP